MEKCKLCDRPIGKDSPFTNYCSSRCEEKAVNHYGEEKGRKKQIGCFATILLVIIIISFNGIKECSPDKKQIPKGNQDVEVDNISTTSRTKEKRNKIDETTMVTNEDTVKVKNENIENDEPVENVISDTVRKSYDRYQANVDKATEMLKRGKSVREIADSTVLLKEDIRKLKRELRNKE